MRVFLSIAGVLIFVAGLGAGFLEHLQVLWVSCVGFVGCLIAANLDRISEFTASTKGVSAKTREVITRAESAITQLQSLAAVVAEVTLSLVKRSGRLGGYSDADEDAVRERVLGALDKLAVPKSELPSIMKEWHRITEYDYVLAILGGNTVPGGMGPAVEEWKALRAGGFSKVATPEQVREYLEKHGFLTPERGSYLEDYEYYRQHGVHRRLSVWHRRQDWGRLEKTPS
jgi:hypothetical protein